MSDYSSYLSTDSPTVFLVLLLCTVLGGLLVELTLPVSPESEYDLPWSGSKAATFNWNEVPKLEKNEELFKRLGVSSAGLENWKVVVIGDTKTPSNWNFSGVYFLSVEDQKKLGYMIHDLLPYRSYARKNIGYLFAIQNGAKTIYETDDDNILIVKKLSDKFDVELTYVDAQKLSIFESQKDRNVVNPYVHFGQRSIWPRGYPLDSIAKNEPEPSVRIASKEVKPWVQQGLANGDPDVDAIFRLTRVSKGKLIRVEFDPDANPVAIPPGTMCPYNTQNTLYHSEAFWGLLIPVTTTFRVCDIWRGYWVQRLLIDAGGVLAFYPPSVRQDRNVHNYFDDFLDEDDLYKKARPLVDFLLNWSSGEDHLFDRGMALMTALVQKEFFGEKDVSLLSAWFHDLASLGYVPPKPTNFSKVFSTENLKQLPSGDYKPKSLPTTNLDV